MADPYYVDDGSPDGAILGRDGGKAGFFGTTPVAQQVVTGSITTTISQVATSGKWAFATSTAAKNLVTQVQDIKLALDNLGLSVDG
jgi:hypothetical protein